MAVLAGALIWTILFTNSAGNVVKTARLRVGASRVVSLHRRLPLSELETDRKRSAAVEVFCSPSFVPLESQGRAGLRDVVSLWRPEYVQVSHRERGAQADAVLPSANQLVEVFKLAHLGQRLDRVAVL